ncbi:MAG: cohesin domain-containing protein [Dehalococcoidia bacterium]
MSKRSIGLVVFLVASLLLVACARDSEGTGEVAVRIEPATMRADAGDQIVVAVRVDPEGRGLSGGELNLAFDPQVLSVVDIEPGDLFGPEPLVGAEMVDNDSGTLLYALARKGQTSPPTPPSVFAEITFKVAEDARRGRYELTVTSAGLADEAFRDILDISLGSATVRV